MALELQNRRILFPSRVGSESIINEAVTFSRQVRIVGTAINGFNLTFNNGDHSFLRAKVDISQPVIRDRTVTFSVSLLLRDDSGHIDDPYSGYIDVLLIADTI